MVWLTSSFFALMSVEKLHLNFLVTKPAKPVRGVPVHCARATQLNLRRLLFPYFKENQLCEPIC